MAIGVYPYVGPAAIKAMVSESESEPGAALTDLSALANWRAAQPSGERDEPFTYVLDRLGVARPAGFTTEILFRRCDACDEITIVHDGDLVCVFCDAGLPAVWNVTARRPPPPAQD